MPTWAFGTSATASGQPNGINPITISKPTSTADGDLLVAFILGDAAATITAPSGGATWNQATGSPQSIAGALKGACFYKFALSEGASYAFSGANIFEGVIGRWTNTTAWSFDISNGANATATTLNAPAVTTTGFDDLVIRAALSWNATTLSFASGSSRISSGSNGDLIRVYDQDKTPAGSTGTDLATANASNQMVAFTVTFIAAAAVQDTPELYGVPYGLLGQLQMRQLLAQ